MAAFMVSIPPGFETFNVIVNHDDIASEIFFTCWLPRYQAFITFRGSSIGVGKVSDGPLASLLGSFPVLHMDEFPFLYFYWFKTNCRIGFFPKGSPPKNMKYFLGKTFPNMGGWGG